MSNNPLDNQNSDSASGEDWTPCAPGEIQGIAARLQSRERRLQNLSLAKTSVGAALVTAVLVLGVGFLLGPSDDLGAIGCFECVANFEAYGLHLTDGTAMGEPTAAEMHEHLEQCENCRAKFENEYPGLLASIVQGIQRVYAAVVSSGPLGWS